MSQISEVPILVASPLSRLTLPTLESEGGQRMERSAGKGKRGVTESQDGLVYREGLHRGLM